MEDTVFIVSSCVKNKEHYRQLMRCLSSIRLFFECDVIVINDTTEELILQEPRIKVVNTLNLGSGDQQPFKFFLESEYIKAVFLQDSMIINKKFDIDNVAIKFLWYFTNHVTDWDKIIEEDTLITHTELIKSRLYRDYNTNIDFLKFAVSCLENKEKWVGCFGNCCVLTREALTKLNAVVPFIDKMITYNTNRLRRVNESIFSLICHFVYPIDFKNSVDGWYNNTGMDETWCHIGEFVSKVSFNR